MFLISLVVVLTQTHAHSQEWGRWFHGPTEFREYAAWVPELNKNELALLEVMCAADEAYVSVQFTSTSGQQRSGTANLQISGQTFSLPARYTDTDDAVAWRIRASADLVQALRSESRVRVSIDGETATFRLRGSSVAISKALEGCGQGRGYHKDWKNF